MKKFAFICTILSISISTYLFTKVPKVNTSNEAKAINTLLDDWHAAAANADYKGYFEKIANDGIYIGTDATENWDKKAFETFSKPYFDKGTAWDFRSLERHIYFSKDRKTAWFNELLDTWMKVCQGSGVLEKEGNEWKIKHYVLSMTIPNNVTKDVIPLKAEYENALIEKLKEKK